MREDPNRAAEWTTITAPPLSGAGSGRAAWITFANRTAAANRGLCDLIEQQSRVITELEAEVRLLRKQRADRAPQGGKAPLPEETIAGIERDLEAGLSLRKAAARNRVSLASAQRVKARLAAIRRESASAAR